MTSQVVQRFLKISSFEPSNAQTENTTCSPSDPFLWSHQRDVQTIRITGKSDENKGKGAQWVTRERRSWAGGDDTDVVGAQVSDDLFFVLQRQFSGYTTCVLPPPPCISTQPPNSSSLLLVMFVFLHCSRQLRLPPPPLPPSSISLPLFHPTHLLSPPPRLHLQS